MPEYVSNGYDWFSVTTTERINVEAGTTAKSTIISTKMKKKD